HWIDLDFGDQLRDIGPKDRLFLFAAGSVEYAYPESIWAAHQAGVAMQPPVLERKGADGKWTKVAEIGFPAGMPRMMSFDLTGKLTRYGDVTELLRETDDRFVLIGPGDETEIKFDARSLPSLPNGWKRSYVLRSWGYCKDTAPFTATGDTIEPLPFRGMTTY